MDCEAFNDLLIDYLYDELDEVRRAAMRKHLETCAACNEASDRLSRGRHAACSLALIEAPPPNGALLEAMQASAAIRAEPLRDGHGGSVASVVPTGARARIPRWMRRVGEMAMQRQVAMAAVFLLMIGFGLSYHQPQAPTRPVQTSDEPGAQVIPATELPAADPPRPVSDSRRRVDALHLLAPLSQSERTTTARRRLLEPQAAMSTDWLERYPSRRSAPGPRGQPLAT